MSLDAILLEAIESQRPFLALIKDSATQRAFRAAMTSSNPKLDTYLATDAMMADMMGILTSTGVSVQSSVWLTNSDSNPPGIFEVVNVFKATLPHTLVCTL